MHDTAFAIGSKFIELYAPAEPFTVIELGSLNVNGTLCTSLPARASYIGIDAAAGPNVNVVALGRALPFAAAVADLTIASSVFEHDQAFWLTFLELCRLTKPGGYIYLSAPSNGAVHRYPKDCWRFYPDAGDALADWGRQNGLDIVLIESFVADRQRDIWNDFVAVYARGQAHVEKTRAFLHSALAARNIRRLDSDDLIEPREATEDQELLALAAGTLQALEQRAAAAVSGIKVEAQTEERTGGIRRLTSKELVESPAQATLRLKNCRRRFTESFKVIDSALAALRQQTASKLSDSERTTVTQHLEHINTLTRLPCLGWALQRRRLSGWFWPDGWASRDCAFEMQAHRVLTRVELRISLPSAPPAPHARLRVTVKDVQAEFDISRAGDFSCPLEVSVTAGETFTLSISSDWEFAPRTLEPTDGRPLAYLIKAILFE